MNSKDNDDCYDENNNCCDFSNILYLSSPELEAELRRLFCEKMYISGLHPQKSNCRRQLVFDNDTTTNKKNTVDNSLNQLMEEFKRNGIDYEYCPDEENKIEDYTLKQQINSNNIHSSIFNRNKLFKKKKRNMVKSGYNFCVFCKNNEQPPFIYMGHKLRNVDNIITCPILRQYICPICHASGDNAHTRKYCPLTGSSWSKQKAMQNIKSNVLSIPGFV